MKKQGKFLEDAVAILFEKAGFKVKSNTRKYGFEVDVLASKGDDEIIIECKQYNSYLNVGSLLHEWESKGRRAKVNKIVMVLSGVNIKDKYYEIAKELGIYILDDGKVHYLNSLEKKELKDKLNDLIQFDEKAYISKKRKKYIRFMSFLLFLFSNLVHSTYMNAQKIILITRIFMGLSIIIFFLTFIKNK